MMSWNKRTRVDTIFATFLVLLSCYTEESKAVSIHGIVRLRLRPASSSPNEGILQVLHGKFWGDVCFSNWTMKNADVACRHLGYAGAERTHAMVATARKETFRGIYLRDVRCRGSEESLWDCENTLVSDYSTTCEALHVVWLSCASTERSTIETTTIQEELLEPPPIEIGRISHSSVSLDWENWFEFAQKDLPEEFVISFQILYRPIGNPRINFTNGAQVPGYFKHGTVEKLNERTPYEFKLEAIKLNPDYPGESVGLVSSIVSATTYCSGPRSVETVTVTPGFPRQLSVTWPIPIDEDCSPENFVVEYKLINKEQCKAENEAGLDGTVKTDASIVFLTDLHPYSTYIVNVTVVNRFGRSTEKQTVATTNEDAPSGTPTEIKTEYSHQNSLVAMWGPPDCGKKNGVITGYTYMLLDVQTDRVIYSGSTQVTIVHLPNVDPLYKYKFLVAARTMAGMGPYGAISVEDELNISDICGEASTERIASGSKANLGAYPWMAQIWHVKYGTKFCAGSILDNHWILTAAHCIEQYNVTRDDIRIQLGDFDTLLPEPQQRVYDVDQIHVHPGFNMDMFDDDIALIRVRDTIEFSNYIKPICLPEKKLARELLKPSPHDDDKRTGTVAGWGDDRTGITPRYLKQIKLPLVDRSICKKTADWSFTPNMFCAGFSTSDSGDTCPGDSGAPFMMRWHGRLYVTGLVSWGSPLCDQADKYGYYTRVFKYMSWIKRMHPNVSIIKKTEV